MIARQEAKNTARDPPTDFQKNTADFLFELLFVALRENATKRKTTWPLKPITILACI